MWSGLMMFLTHSVHTIFPCHTKHPQTGVGIRMIDTERITSKASQWP